jgi:outer membrane protein OmpA-like peptidoglycan-associated protein
MKRLWSFVGDEDDPFGPGTDLIISLLAVFLVILVITTKSYQETSTKYQQSVSDVASSKTRVEELEKLLALEQEKISALYRKISAGANERKSQFPPNIFIRAAEGYDFNSGSAELTPDLEKYIRNTIAARIEENIKDFDVNTVVVIGHTDGQSVNSSTSNLDGLVESVAMGSKPMKDLSAGSNADLGLMRALAVVRKLQDIQKQEKRFPNLDPRKGYRTYSAGQLTLKSGEFAQPNPDPNSEKERRRIEIHFTKSGGG